MTQALAAWVELDVHVGRPVGCDGDSTGYGEIGARREAVDHMSEFISPQLIHDAVRDLRAVAGPNITENPERTLSESLRPVGGSEQPRASVGGRRTGLANRMVCC